VLSLFALKVSRLSQSSFYVSANSVSVQMLSLFIKRAFKEGGERSHNNSVLKCEIQSSEREKGKLLFRVCYIA